MKLAVRRTSTAVAAVATAGVSTVFVGAAPALAATEPCGDTGTLVAPGVCEQVFTSDGTFTPTTEMSQLEVLLVGAGGDGLRAENGSGSVGYAAGGGGEVKIVDFTGATDPIAVTVATPSGAEGRATDGTIDATVNSGEDGVVDLTTYTATGGASGNGNSGSSVPAQSEPTVASHGAGGGAGGTASGANGGAGVVVSALAPSGSLFSGDPRCFGGGGAVSAGSTAGIPGCGGGVSGDPVANSGGGAGSVTNGSNAGAAGVVIVRWTADVTLTFDVNGHGTAPAPQTIPAGSTAARPADPTADGFQFAGWYTDAQLTTLADFNAPLTTSTTYYAKWTRVLAATGGTVDAGSVALGVSTVVAGAGLLLLAARRRRPTAD